MQTIYDAMIDHIGFNLRFNSRWNWNAQFDFEEFVPFEEVLKSFNDCGYSDEEITNCYDGIKNEFLEWKKSELEDESKCHEEMRRS
jgi:hypothetical protein